MPAIVQTLAWASPLYHVVNLTRSLVLGDVGLHLFWNFLWLVAVAIVLAPVAIHLMRRLVIK